MKVYLAGPMQGLPDFNFPAFFNAAAMLREKGFEVFNPAEADMHSFGSMEAIQKFYGQNKDLMKRFVMTKDLNWIMFHADAIALLPGWEKSSGVGVELALARFLKLPEIVL